jgi:hypothetical protein
MMYFHFKKKVFHVFDVRKRELIKLLTVRFLTIIIPSFPLATACQSIIAA